MTEQTTSKSFRDVALTGSLIFFHLWGTWLVFNPSGIGERMFEAVCFGIFSNLGIISGDKILRTMVELKWGAKNADSK